VILKLKGVFMHDLQTEKATESFGVRSKKYSVITLCGSTRFKDHFEKVNKKLTLAGNVVISVGCYRHSGDIFTQSEKVMLDEIHKQKIDMADIIYVINVGGYIGQSTRSEIDYATAHNKKIVYLE
jgi:hypothetical protein